MVAKKKLLSPQVQKLMSDDVAEMLRLSARLGGSIKTEGFAEAVMVIGNLREVLVTIEAQLKHEVERIKAAADAKAKAAAPKKRVQCKACPWRVDVVPEKDIPNGYCEMKHKDLKNTIADGTGSLRPGPIRAMACHETKPGKDLMCVGWLANQLGPGNNIALRMRALAGDLPSYTLVGEQHETFKDTLPKGLMDDEGFENDEEEYD